MASRWGNCLVYARGDTADYSGDSDFAGSSRNH